MSDKSFDAEFGMKRTFRGTYLLIALLASTTVTSFGADGPVDSPSEENQAVSQTGALRAEKQFLVRERSPRST
jgi:hypothetical protein